MSLKSKIEAAIRSIKHPDSGKDLLDLGLVQSANVTGDKVVVVLEIDAEDAQKLAPLRVQLDAKLGEIDGVESHSVVMTAVRKPQSGSPPPSQQKTPQKAPPKAKPVSGVRHVIAIASGKGGVGKSTTAVNLAYALINLGYRVGLVDCDIYGPSASLLLGQNEKPQFDENDQIIPLESNGLKSISMSNIIPADSAAVWRGPMVAKSLQQFLQGAAWDKDGPLDFLIADLPPGTGDVQLSLAQTATMSGALIVSTPQDMALIDARKAYDMFQKVDVPVLGLIENMSYFLCPHCGERTEIFGHGGARETAAEKDIPFLGEIPLHLDIRTSADAGKSLVLADPTNTLATPYLDIARALCERLNVQAPA